MKQISMIWKSWYGEEELNITFPDAWNIHLAGMQNVGQIDENEIRSSILTPIESPTLFELATGKKTVAIAIDDLTQPTKTARILPLVIDELERAGVPTDGIRIIVSNGAHRPLDRRDLVKKVGIKLLQKYAVYNHICYDNVESLGTTNRGIPIKINRHFLNSELKIGVSLVVPHLLAGYSGGSKIALPGLSGIDTLEASHSKPLSGSSNLSADQKVSSLRQNIEKVARRVGLDFCINVIGNMKGEIARVVAGDPIRSHARAVEIATNVYRTELPKDMDIGVFNAFPKDTEFIQCSNALTVWSNPEHNLVKQGGTVVIISAATEGRGCHFLNDVGMRLYRKLDQYPNNSKKLSNQDVVIFSPTACHRDVIDFFSDRTLLFTQWDHLVAHLIRKYGTAMNTDVVVFPCGSIQPGVYPRGVFCKIEIPKVAARNSPVLQA